MATTSDVIRWGIIGCGDVCEVKSGPAFQKASGSALVAVMRRSGELAADFARRHGVPRWYDDAAALIADPEVDAVYVATPPGAHEELALAVCKAGKPCYVEKPMARNLAACTRMADAFAAAGVPLYVAYYRRALPRFVKAREIVASGALGRVSNVSCAFAGPHYLETAASVKAGAPLPWRMQAEHAGGGLFLDLACHTLDIVDFFLGPIEEVTGGALNGGTPFAVEDTVGMKFRTSGGAQGIGAWRFGVAEREDQVVVEGERGRLRLSTFGNEPVELRLGFGDDARTERFDLPNPPHIQQPFIQGIVDELRGVRAPSPNGVSAARTSAVMDTVLAGYYGTREDGFWRDPDRWPGRHLSKR